mmetsp:Transcript_12282/g.31167  ORF Transcript_12282/g.31167 Transcript_12282/m.31167 type:complete len:207 (+) Transcript_12282:792-1412(+)
MRTRRGCWAPTWTTAPARASASVACLRPATRIAVIFCTWCSVAAISGRTAHTATRSTWSAPCCSAGGANPVALHPATSRRPGLPPCSPYPQRTPRSLVSPPPSSLRSVAATPPTGSLPPTVVTAPRVPTRYPVFGPTPRRPPLEEGPQPPAPEQALIVPTSRRTRCFSPRLPPRAPVPLSPSLSSTSSSVPGLAAAEASGWADPAV